MSEPQPSEFPPDDPLADMRRLVAKRLALAGGMVAMLLGGLALFDHFATQEEPDDEPGFTQPVPVGPRKEATQPVTVANTEPAPEVGQEKSSMAPVPEGTQGVPEKVPAQEAIPAPAPGLPAGPAVGNGGRREDRPVARDVPVTPRPATPVSPSAAPQAPPRGASPAPANAVPPAASAPATPSLSPAGPMPPRSSIPDEAAIAAGAARPNLREPVPSRHAAPPASAANTVTQPPPLVPMVEEPTVRVQSKTAPTGLLHPPAMRLANGFRVQAGVFAAPQGAEDLVAKLAQHGIPATVESHVQVGPFKTREEAEAASRKLKALGIAPVLQAPRGAKR